ncbi:MAG: VOC family protein [Proteobacteria bacterium]|nr:VOC family protein [Pseudomonadota bacterium]
MQVQPYLFFDGRCEEAIEFYKKALGAKVEMLLRFKDGPPPDQNGEGCAGPMPDGNKIMHASLKIDDALVMASDGMAAGKPEFKGVSLALATKDDAEAKAKFTALSEGGTVQQPLIKTFFSSSFGMCADKFGVNWMITVAQ